MAVTGYLTRVATGRTITESGGLPWIEGDLGISGGGTGSFTNWSVDAIYTESPVDPTDITLPGWAAAGDFCYMVVHGQEGATGVPTGFTPSLAAFNYDTTVETLSCYKELTSTDISNGYIDGWNGGWVAMTTLVMFLSGQDPVDPIDFEVADYGFDGSGSGSDATWATQTPSTDNCVVGFFAGHYGSGGFTSWPTVDQLDSTTGNYSPAWVGGVEQTTATATGAQTLHFDGNYSRWGSIVVAFKPAAGGGMSDSDTGSGSDSQSLSAAPSGAETATGTDASTVAAATSQTDTGTGTDAGTVAVAVPGSDTATGTEAASTTATLSGSETSSGTDASSIAVALSDTETGTGTDAGSITVPTSGGSDPGSGTEGFTLVVTISTTDTGSGADANSIAAAIGATETGSGSESSSLEAVGGEETIDGGLDISYSDDQVTDRGIGMQEDATGVEGDPEIVYVVRAVSDGDTAQGYDMANPNYRPGGGTLLSEGTRDLGRSSLSGVE